MAQVFVSLGTNVNRDENLHKGLLAMQQAFGSLTLSSLFESEAVGFDGAAFYNMVIAFSSDNSVEQVGEALREIEFTFGRTLDAKKFSPRTLDLDMLLFDDLILQTPVQIPRDEITENAFVLWPLAEIAGQTLHPVLQKSYQTLWQNYNKNKQQLLKIPFDFQG